MCCKIILCAQHFTKLWSMRCCTMWSLLIMPKWKLFNLRTLEALKDVGLGKYLIKRTWVAPFLCASCHWHYVIPGSTWPVTTSKPSKEERVDQSATTIFSHFLNRYSVQSAHFMNAYEWGLTGKQAAWAAKKFHGYHVLPESILKDLNNVNLL